MNTVSVKKSLLTRVAQYMADCIHEFRETETAPDGSIEIDAQEIIDSELKLLGELQAALTQPEQPAEQEFHRVFEANESLEESLAEQPEPCVNCSGSGITPIGDGYSVDACPQCTPEQPEAGRDGDFSFAYIAGMLDSYAACIHEYAPADDFARWHYVPEIQDAATWLRALRPQPQEANAEAVRLLRELRDAARAYWDGGMVGAAEKRDRFRLALRAADAYIAAAQKEPGDE